MRRFYLLILIVFLLSFQTVFAVSVNFSDCAITSTLRVGSKGAEVQCLQGKVGVVADGIFGPLTNLAVKAFQSSKGLVADGIFGPLSRAVFNILTGSGGIYPAGCASTIGYSPTTGTKCDSSLTVGENNKKQESLPESSVVINNKAQDTNPNLVNLDKFIETVIGVNRKNGVSEKELSLIADTLKKEVMNSDIDYNKKFKELLISESKLSVNFNTHLPLTIFDKIVSKTLSFLGITPSIAQASAGIPFGGALIFPFFCAYNDSWMITITPLPPTFVVLLTYYPGTQAFASYNIPFTSWLLGTYVIPGVCIIPAGPVPIVIPTEGTITPMVGSSPL